MFLLCPVTLATGLQNKSLKTTLSLDAISFEISLLLIRLWHVWKEIDQFKNHGKITWIGTAAASWFSMVLTLDIAFNCPIMDPDKTLTKKTFQIVKDKTLMHALLFLPLCETDPSTVENSIIVGGTAY